MSRQNVSSGSLWEDKAGFSRAVRVGPQVFVAGTTGTGEGAYEQTKAIFTRIELALKQADARLSDVVRTRMFIVNLADTEAVTRAHKEVFGEIKPAATLVQFKALVEPSMLVEIEVDAIIGSA